MALCVAEKGFDKCQSISQELNAHIYEVLQQEHLFHKLLEIMKKRIDDFNPSPGDTVIDLTYDTDEDMTIDSSDNEDSEVAAYLRGENHIVASGLQTPAKKKRTSGVEESK
jgi:hypothetical protein